MKKKWIYRFNNVSTRGEDLFFRLSKRICYVMRDHDKVLICEAENVLTVANLSKVNI